MSKRKNKLVKIDELLEDIKYNEPTNEPPKATPATPKAAPKKQKQSDIDKVIEDEFGGIKVSKTKKK